jgi:V/A-type H+-transporting ATPase subunit E
MNVSVSKVKEGLSAIASEILADVLKEAEAIILESEKEAKKILKTAKEEADKNYASAIDQATTKAENEKRKITSLTEVEMRNRLLQTKETVVDTAFQKALDRLDDFAKTEEYNDYLLGLIEKAAERIGSKKLIVRVNAKDKAWLKQDHLSRLAKKSRFELKLSDQTEDCIGGCKIQTVDGKVVYDNTIENRLQELKPALRVEVAKILFGKET